MLLVANPFKLTLNILYSSSLPFQLGPNSHWNSALHYKCSSGFEMLWTVLHSGNFNFFFFW